MDPKDRDISHGRKRTPLVIALVALVVVSMVAVVVSFTQRASSERLGRMDAVLDAPVETSAPHKTEGTMTAEEREELLRRVERDLQESQERAKKGPPDIGCAAECKRKPASAAK